MTGPAPSSGLSFREPWRDLRGDAPEVTLERTALLNQLERELAPGHPLHGVGAAVVGRSDAADDVVLLCTDGRWAIVHLTWAGHIQQPPWPRTVLYADVLALDDALPAAALG